MFRFKNHERVFFIISSILYVVLLILYSFCCSILAENGRQIIDGGTAMCVASTILLSFSENVINLCVKWLDHFKKNVLFFVLVLREPQMVHFINSHLGVVHLSTYNKYTVLFSNSYMQLILTINFQTQLYYIHRIIIFHYIILAIYLII